MYASKSTNHRRRTESGHNRRYEHTSAQTYIRRALERETDRELQLACRGTWLELEVGRVDDPESDYRRREKHFTSTSYAGEAVR